MKIFKSFHPSTTLGPSVTTTRGGGEEEYFGLGTSYTHSSSRPVLTRWVWFTRTFCSGDGTSSEMRSERLTSSPFKVFVSYNPYLFVNLYSRFRLEEHDITSFFDSQYLRSTVWVSVRVSPVLSCSGVREKEGRLRLKCPVKTWVHGLYPKDWVSVSKRKVTGMGGYGVISVKVLQVLGPCLTSRESFRTFLSLNPFTPLFTVEGWDLRSKVTTISCHWGVKSRGARNLESP